MLERVSDQETTHQENATYDCDFLNDASQAMGEESPSMEREISETESLLGCFLILGQINGAFDDSEKFHESLFTLTSLAPAKALKKAAQMAFVGAKIEKYPLARVTDERLPLIAREADGRWFLLAKKIDGGYLIQRPDNRSPEKITDEELQTLWAGRVVKITNRRSATAFIRKFDIRWFIPELLRYRLVAVEVLIASAILQVLALISPLFFQVVMDKVLIHNALSTLDVLVTVLVTVSVFEVILQALRQYLATRTAARIDARLGGKLYRHLIDLPLTYFKSCPVGVTVMRVNEFNSIREFITSAANTLVIDLSFTVIFFAVMYLYSPFLTAIVAGSVPCYMLVSFLVTAPLQKRIEKLYRDGAVNNSFLTETLSGVETVKALALEPQMVRRWERQTRDFVYSNFEVQKLMQLSSSLVQIIQKCVMVMVLWFGATMVIGLELSIGQLIAFNMMSNHVMQPIIRITDLWREFVQTRVAVERLAQVLNTLPEISDKHTPPPDNMRGKITFEDVTFRYAVGGEKILENFNLTIPAGKMVAFVGRSGSGKSTITRLIQKLYVPEIGRVCLDDIHLAELNPVLLRQRMSSVLQENFLFNRSVRDNIAVTDPATPLSRIVEASEIAGAHEFILELKDGYDTILAEGGLSLSGGQRQRIAIARSLISDPSVLIFDEATSALDDHSQAIIQNSMKQIRGGRTVILIAHRLSTVRDCDAIFVLEKGKVIEQGTHDELIKIKGGAYRQLWDLQRAELSLEADKGAQSAPAEEQEAEYFQTFSTLTGKVSI